MASPAVSRNPVRCFVAHSRDKLSFCRLGRPISPYYTPLQMLAVAHALTSIRNHGRPFSFDIGAELAATKKILKPVISNAPVKTCTPLAYLASQCRLNLFSPVAKRFACSP